MFTHGPINIKQRSIFARVITKVVKTMELLKCTDNSGKCYKLLRLYQLFENCEVSLGLGIITFA